MEYRLTRGQTGCGSHIEFIAGGLLGGGSGGGETLPAIRTFLGHKVQHLMVVILLRVTNSPNQLS